MDIVIVAQYLGDLEHLKTTNGRFTYLGRMLAENNNVEIITTTFLHAYKCQVKSVPEFFGKCKITAIYEPGYPRNICLQRFVSHHKLAVNIKKYLEKRKVPDIIYTAVPSLSVAEEIKKYCQENNVKFVIDVQDLWPEAFRMVFNIPLISNALFYPLEKQANRIYFSADEIIAVSQTYADRALRVNKKCKRATVVYLGTEKNIFDKYIQADRKAEFNEEIRIAYVGSLSRSYDIDSVIEAIKRIKSEKVLRFVVMGDGAYRSSFEEHARKAGINYTFTGALHYSEMVECLYNCDIAINPIRKGSAQSIINKVGDYAMAGIPVVNTQECQEYRDLLEHYHSGINCACENVDGLVKALETLIDDEDLRKEMGARQRIMAKELFDREQSYKRIVNIIENLQ